MTHDRVIRACWAAGSAFVAAALSICALNTSSPFERGWWLASYLFLVGGAAQVLLVGGQFVIAARRQAAVPARALIWTQFALWNIGTVAVAGADVAQIVPGVAAGSAILIIAVILFHAGLRQIGQTARRRTRALEHGYITLLALLTASVVLGTFLACAAPGR